MFVVVDRAGMRVLETPPATGPPFLERLNPALKHLAKVVRIDHGMLKACLALDAEAGSDERLLLSESIPEPPQPAPAGGPPASTQSTSPYPL
eukprot:5153657-Pyramimonas_sp.AAC.2